VDEANEAVDAAAIPLNPWDIPSQLRMSQFGSGHRPPLHPNSTPRTRREPRYALLLNEHHPSSNTLVFLPCSPSPSYPSFPACPSNPSPFAFPQFNPRTRFGPYSWGDTLAEVLPARKWLDRIGMMMGYVVLVVSVVFMAPEGDTRSSLARVQLDACGACAVAFVTRGNSRTC
jgi:hypothetical protein